MDPELAKILAGWATQFPLAAGAVGAFVLFFKGVIRTAQELARSEQRGDENLKRAERAEDREDKIAEAVKSLADQQSQLIAFLMRGAPDLPPHGSPFDGMRRP